MPAIDAKAGAGTDTPLLITAVHEAGAVPVVGDKEWNENEQSVSSKREYWQYVYDEVV